ncbi:MAG: hypothetical protein IPK13_22935 [Deltaproteobacteria bacterium]|nr:hypothetical protein [Deltaproteobacteria bacterium]
MSERSVQSVLEQSGSVAERFRQALGFLAESETDEQLLEELAAKVQEVRAGKEGEVEWVFPKERRGGILVCHPPLERNPAQGVPESYAAIASKFNGITCEYGGGGWLGFCGLNQQGGLAGDGGWEAEALEEGENEELLEKLAEQELTPDDIQGAFYCGQNWILFDPFRKNKRNEPALAFVSHGDCKWEPIKSADNLSYAGVLLRLLVWGLLGKPGLIEEIYS